jgi:hypothetical protein
VSCNCPFCFSPPPERLLRHRGSNLRNNQVSVLLRFSTLSGHSHKAVTSLVFGLRVEASVTRLSLLRRSLCPRFQRSTVTCTVEALLTHKYFQTPRNLWVMREYGFEERPNKTLINLNIKSIAGPNGGPYSVDVTIGAGEGRRANEKSAPDHFRHNLAPIRHPCITALCENNRKFCRARHTRNTGFGRRSGRLARANSSA